MIIAVRPEKWTPIVMRCAQNRQHQLSLTTPTAYSNLLVHLRLHALCFNKPTLELRTLAARKPDYLYPERGRFTTTDGLIGLALGLARSEEEEDESIMAAKLSTPFKIVLRPSSNSILRTMVIFFAVVPLLPSGVSPMPFPLPLVPTSLAVATSVSQP